LRGRDHHGEVSTNWMRPIWKKRAVATQESNVGPPASQHARRLDRTRAPGLEGGTRQDNGPRPLARRRGGLPAAPRKVRAATMSPNAIAALDRTGLRQESAHATGRIQTITTFPGSRAPAIAAATRPEFLSA